MVSTEPRTVTVAGVPLTDLALERAGDYLARAATEGAALDVHLVNAYTISLVDTTPELRGVICNARLNLTDGKPLTWAARFIAKQPLTQVRGPDLFEQVLAEGHHFGLRHFLLGGAEETLALLRRAIARRYPAAEIVGWHSPPFRPLTNDERDVQDQAIRESGAHLVWVGLGTPKQDYEAARLARELGITAVAVGAAFDFSAGTLRRAPDWVSRLGLEWTFRLMMEPRRLWRRYTFGNFRFLRALIREGRHRADS